MSYDPINSPFFLNPQTKKNLKTTNLANKPSVRQARFDEFINTFLAACASGSTHDSKPVDPLWA
jgi:hypothetical protein